ncbi:MAG: Rpp14/Pop5 family protein [Candidatus Woesearchaeota archaeon]
MKLLPTLKEKKRYVVFEIIAEKKFSLSEIKEFVEGRMFSFWGELGMARAAPIFIEEKFNPEKQKFVVKVGHKYVDELKAALALGKSIKNSPIIIKSVTVSGILKKAGARMG